MLKLTSIFSEAEKRAARLTSLDILRGVTMFFMIMVDNMSGDAFWPFSEHDWDGVSSADCVFPMFLFIVGVSTVLAFRRKKLQEFEVWTAVAKRTFLLILIGVIINWSAGKFSFVHLHFPGILQRIGVCYIAVVLLYCLPPRWLARCIVVALMGIYAGFMYGYPVPPFTWTNPSTNQTIHEECGRGVITLYCAASTYFDQQIFGPNHMRYPQVHEGVLSTLTSIATSWAGVECGMWFVEAHALQKAALAVDANIQRSSFDRRSLFQRIASPRTFGGVILKWSIISVVSITASWILNIWIPLNKPVWSLSFVLWTGGLGMALLVIFYLVLDYFVPMGPQWFQKVVFVVTQPFNWLGNNPLFVFIFMDLFDILLIDWVQVVGYSGKTMSLWANWYYYTVQTWVSDPLWASTLFAFYHVILWVAITGYMYYKQIFVTL